MSKLTKYLIASRSVTTNGRYKETWIKRMTMNIMSYIKQQMYIKY